MCPPVYHHNGFVTTHALTTHNIYIHKFIYSFFLLDRIAYYLKSLPL